MALLVDITPIGWIGVVKRSGDEWSLYTKKFTLSAKPDFATIRLNSQGVCGIYVNGILAEGSCGRYMNRITYVEITSLLQQGDNEISLKLGSHFFQPVGEEVYHQRGAWFSAVAAEIEIQDKNGVQTFATDATWEGITEDGSIQVTEFSKISQADYDKFWKAAALIREAKTPKILEAIARVAGNDYIQYASKPWEMWAKPIRTVEAPIRKGINKSDTVITYDFGRTQVGYLQLEYEADCDGEFRLMFDYLEQLGDFGDEAYDWSKVVVDRLVIRQPLWKGCHKVDILRRRAARYMQVHIPKGVELQNIRFRLSLLPGEQIGWFHSSDDMLNRIWEVGKYTLHVNKHQEYESCPRQEMKFFSGDGVVSGMTDYYTFGDKALVEASLSLTEDVGAGIQRDIHMSNGALWDYPAWRIIMIYNHYRYFNDIELVKQYYEESVANLQWMILKAAGNGLIYQYPLWGGGLHTASESVEYTCGYDRLGEKPYLNALFYKSLICMAEFADVLKDERGTEWREMANSVKDAFNERLWDEEAGAYLDTYDMEYIPQDGNALAVLYGIADKERTKRALETMKKELWSPYGSTILSIEKPDTLVDAKAISPMMCTHEAEARFLHGDADGGLELIRRCWGTMLRKGAETFWEYTYNHETWCWPHTCHGWSSGCTYLLSAYVLGIRPETPGYDVIHFEPYDGLEEYSGVIPTVKGLIAVKCTTDAGKKKYEIVIPKGTELKQVLPEHASLKVTEYEKEEQD